MCHQELATSPSTVPSKEPGAVVVSAVALPCGLGYQVSRQSAVLLSFLMKAVAP